VAAADHATVVALSRAAYVFAQLQRQIQVETAAGRTAAELTTARDAIGAPLREAALAMCRASANSGAVVVTLPAFLFKPVDIIAYQTPAPGQTDFKPCMKLVSVAEFLRLPTGTAWGGGAVNGLGALGAVFVPILIVVAIVYSSYKVEQILNDPAAKANADIARKAADRADEILAAQLAGKITKEQADSLLAQVNSTFKPAAPGSGKWPLVVGGVAALGVVGWVVWKLAPQLLPLPLPLRPTPARVGQLAGLWL